MDRELGLLDWRAADGTAFLITLWHDDSVRMTRLRLRLGTTLDWTTSCSYLEVGLFIAKVDCCEFVDKLSSCTL